MGAVFCGAFSRHCLHMVRVMLTAVLHGMILLWLACLFELIVLVVVHALIHLILSINHLIVL
jgi:hypothetical protein